MSLRHIVDPDQHLAIHQELVCSSTKTYSKINCTKKIKANLLHVWTPYLLEGSVYIYNIYILGLFPLWMNPTSLRTTAEAWRYSVTDHCAQGLPTNDQQEKTERFRARVLMISKFGFFLRKSQKSIFEVKHVIFLGGLIIYSICNMLYTYIIIDTVCLYIYYL